jgi:hypothetical protein
MYGVCLLPTGFKNIIKASIVCHFIPGPWVNEIITFLWTTIMFTYKNYVTCDFIMTYNSLSTEELTTKQNNRLRELELFTCFHDWSPASAVSNKPRVRFELHNSWQPHAVLKFRGSPKHFLTHIRLHAVGLHPYRVPTLWLREIWQMLIFDMSL